MTFSEQILFCFLVSFLFVWFFLGGFGFFFNLWRKINTSVRTCLLWANELIHKLVRVVLGLHGFKRG